MVNNNGYTAESELEHRFWLQILGDHSRFIHNGLAPQEKELIRTADQFILLFDGLLERARGTMDAAAWQAFAGEAMKAGESLRAFKLEILRRHLKKKVATSLSPTFLNHMLNELGEYLKNLEYLSQGMVIPVKSPVHHLLLWVLDGIGHAGSIYCRLDSSQTVLRMAAKKYEELWSKKYLETVEYAGFLRTGLFMFPSLGRFDRDVADEMFKFKDFLECLRVKITNAEAIGVLPALVPDHMAREECYFLLRLYQSDPTNVPAPKCDPAKPRIDAP